MDPLAALGPRRRRRHPDDLGGLEHAPTCDAAARDDCAIRCRAAGGLSRRRRSARPGLCAGLLGDCVCRLARRRASGVVPPQPGRRRVATALGHRRGRVAVFLSRRAFNRLFRPRSVVAPRRRRRRAASPCRGAVAGRGRMEPRRCDRVRRALGRRPDARRGDRRRAARDDANRSSGRRGASRLAECRCRHWPDPVLERAPERPAAAD